MAPRYEDFLRVLRSHHPPFAKASALQPDDKAEWQSAVYLLTGCPTVWDRLGPTISELCSIEPVVYEAAFPERSWTDAECMVMQWAAHFWDQGSHPASFPVIFESALFRRWIVALHLRRRLVMY